MKQKYLIQLEVRPYGAKTDVRRFPFIYTDSSKKADECAMRILLAVCDMGVEPESFWGETSIKIYKRSVDSATGMISWHPAKECEDYTFFRSTTDYLDCIQEDDEEVNDG